jgi:hypothetical protein
VLIINAFLLREEESQSSSTTTHAATLLFAFFDCFAPLFFSAASVADNIYFLNLGWINALCLSLLPALTEETDQNLSPSSLAA